MVPLEKGARGYFAAVLEGVEPGSRYFFRLNGHQDRPDPASRFQPQGVHGPSEVVDPHFPWSDDSWAGLPLRDYVIYELHAGTYTSEGTLTAIIPHLDTLKDLGVTAVELMPVAQFPGGRNWGYDGAHPFAVQNTYGGPAALKGLVDACHARGLAVILDVVYNHLGPDWPNTAPTSPGATALPGARRSISTDREAMRCGGISSTTPGSGWRNTILTPCVWTRCTPLWISPRSHS